MVGCRMLRNNNGMAIHKKPGGKEQRVRYGLGTGTSDLIGWTPVLITQAMVGTTVAVFTAGEGKRGDDFPTLEQESFVNAVNNSGGLAFFYGSDQEATDALKIIVANRGWALRPRFQNRRPA